MATSNYIGKVCPYCKTPFKDDDEIVICSDCEMPHHKDCWVDNQGCTTFGCGGTIKATSDASPDPLDFEIEFYDEPTEPDSPSIKSTEFCYCTRCGAQNLSTSAFCCKCGSPLSQIQNQQQTGAVKSSATLVNPYGYVQNGYYPDTRSNSYGFQGSNTAFNSGSQSDIELLIGKNIEYYLPKFNDMKARNTKSSWNWCAFLFTPYWMIYRKMYGYGAAVLGGAFLLSLIGGLFLSCFSLAAYIAFGILGNYVYMKTLEKKALQMGMLSGGYKTDYANKNGGTNATATVLAIVGYAILTAVIQLA
ncbi:MAG: DUF2628 domain-containing protein [Blautia sp.]|nr:DUF2628 domain-containing protein [Blautia sp.]